MKYIKKIILISFLFSLFISCTANKKTNATVPNNSIEITAAAKQLSIAQKLKDNNHLSIEERITLYYQLKKEAPNRYNFEEESELNAYAYELLNQNLKTEAIEIFKLNITQFPKSGKAHYNLADAYSNLSYTYQELAKANQEKANEIWSILEMNDDWGREIFHFPIRFAKDINYKGIEDARFPKGWSDTTSNFFWTYLFGWNIESVAEITTSELEKNLKLYFDGLMMSVNRDASFDPKVTIAKLEKTKTHEFTGTVQVYDAFTTKKSLKLNVLVDYNYCKSKKNTQILFRFSPKELEHEVWEVMKMAKFRDNICGF